MTPAATPRRILVLGASGTIGRATVAALVARGEAVTALVRPAAARDALAGATVRVGDATDPADLAAAVAGADAIVSCLASRTGVPADAWRIDHGANRAALTAATAAGVGHFILLSAICVQKPRLAFQHAKLAFEAELQQSGLRWTIVRPTAFFKSLSGQVGRVRRGRPFLVFGDGALTACTPIADADLAAFIAGCLDDPDRWDRILPIGGPGPAATPRQQGAALFALLGRPPRFTHVPVRLLDGIIAVLGTLGRVVPALAAKAELARIGRYYATESMLVWDAAAGRYDAAQTPATGTITLAQHHAALLAGEAADDRGEHAVF
jgi:divinyl chlorophyllide a 8-vinyl-reductase